MDSLDSDYSFMKSQFSSIEEPEPESLPIAAYENLNSIGETFRYYWRNQLYTDVEFRVQCGDGWINYKAHKLVLCIWSRVMADRLSKAEGIIEITDVAPSAFEDMLKFMYGSVCSLHKQRKEIEQILKVYNAAIKYQVEFLKVLCLNMFVSTPANKYNVFKLLEAGKSIGSDIVQQRCLKVLQEKTANVLAAHDLSNVSFSMMKVILELPSVSFSSEYELITWVSAWVKNELLKTTNKRSYKAIMNQVLPYLKFTTLTTEELGKLLRNLMKNQKSHEKEFDDDIISESDGFKLFMNVVNPGSYPLPKWCNNEVNINRTYSAIDEYKSLIF